MNGPTETALAVVYRHDPDAKPKTDRAIRWIRVEVPFPGEIRCTESRRRTGPMITARFWGVRTDIDPPIVAYREVPA